jgi:hypothetical protein
MIPAWFALIKVLPSVFKPAKIILLFTWAEPLLSK